MLRHRCILCAAALLAANVRNASADVPTTISSAASSLRQEVESFPPMPVYLKPSSSPYRKASFYFPRMREVRRPHFAFHPSTLGTALPLFSITSSSCEYYALRLPLLKAGFHRLPAETQGVASNLVWGRSMPFRDMLSQDSVGDVTSSPSADTKGIATTQRMVNAYQRFNHFPLSHASLGCKRGMAMNVRRAYQDALSSARTTHERETLAAQYSYMPQTWFYPQERDKLIKAMKAAPGSRHFIWKPSRGSCGRGILLSRGGESHQAEWERVMKAIETKAAAKETRKLFGSYVVQEYVENPLLVEGRKIDLRLYVAVTSYNPLTVYWHEEGLVRFAAEEYAPDTSVNPIGVPEREKQLEKDVAAANAAWSETHTSGSSLSSHMHDRFRHLTNYSVGRRYLAAHQPPSTSLNADGATSFLSEHTPEGSVAPLELKWPLQRLWDHLDTQSCTAVGTKVSATPRQRASQTVREEVAQLVTRTLMAVRPVMEEAVRRMPMPGGFFELYGFDVMLDATLKPFLIEVNTLPSLESSSPFDYATKTNVVADLLNVAMLEPFGRAVPPGRALGNAQGMTEMGGRELTPTDAALAHDVTRPIDPCLKDDVARMRSEVELRLKDELAYARGFHRIFPAKPIGNAVSPLAVGKQTSEPREASEAFGADPTLDHLALSIPYKMDLQAYERGGLLTSQDEWALAL